MRPQSRAIISQLWFPVSGLDISVNFQNEIDYLVDWKPRYLTNLHTKVLDSFGWHRIENPILFNIRRGKMMISDTQKFGPKYDFELILDTLMQDVCGMAHVMTTSNKAMDSTRLVLLGNDRPYVMDFAKRNNMGYAMCARVQGLNEIMIRRGPNFAIRTGNAGVGTLDGPEAIAAYNAGIDLMDGNSILDVMDEYGLAMQAPSERISKEWSSDEVTTATVIALTTNVYNMLEEMAGGNP